MKKRMVGVLAAIVLAAFGTFVLVGFVRGAKDRALAGEELVSVYIVDQPVAAGSPLDEISQRVHLEEIPVKARQAGTVSELAALTGLVNVVDLVPGDQLIFSRFDEVVELVGSARLVQAPPGYLEVTVSADNEHILGGTLAAGDTVAVVGAFESTTEPGDDDANQTVTVDGQTVAVPGSADTSFNTSNFPAQAGILAHDVLVTEVSGTLAAADILREDGIDTEIVLPAAGAIYVTLAIDAPTLERIVYAAQFGTIWFAAEPEDAEEGGTRVQTRETVFDSTEATVSVDSGDDSAPDDDEASGEGDR